MIDKWLLNDINEVHPHHHRLVITDALGDGGFLLGGRISDMEVQPLQNLMDG
jgi:hypothetical protein